MTHSFDGDKVAQHVAELYGPNYEAVIDVLNQVSALDESQRKAIAARAGEYIKTPAPAAALGALLQGLAGAQAGQAAPAAEPFPLKDAEDHALAAANKAERTRQLGFATNAAMTLFSPATPAAGAQANPLADLAKMEESLPSLRIVSDAVSAAVVSDLAGTDDFSADDAKLLAEPFKLALGQA